MIKKKKEDDKDNDEKRGIRMRMKGAREKKGRVFGICKNGQGWMGERGASRGDPAEELLEEVEVVISESLEALESRISKVWEEM